MSRPGKRFAAHEAAGVAEEIAGPSNRSFGLIVGGIMLAIAGLSYFVGGHSGLLVKVFAILGVPLVGLGLLRPQTLTVPNRLWMKLGYIMGLIMTPVVMGLLYVLTFIPIGLIMRMNGHDPLRRKKRPLGETYWIMRDPPGPDPKTMPNQF